MTRGRPGLLVLLAAVALAVGCDSDGGNEASATPSASPTASVVVLEHGTPSPTQSPTPEVEVQHTVWLLNLWEDEQYTIYEHPDVPGLGASWVAPRVARVDRVSGPGLYAGTGRSVSFGAMQCRSADVGVVVGGVERPDIPRCGPISPNGHHMLFEVPVEPEVYPPVSQQWLFNGLTGERWLLEERLTGCGGCDWRFGPQWSPDGRYVLFAETAQDGRVFLADLETGTTEVVATGTELQFRPSWSPDDEQPRFLVRGEDGSTVLVDAETGVRTTLPIGWPATFDASGMLAYSPSAGGLSEDEPVVTSVVDLATLEVTDVAGLAPWSFLWWGDIAVAGRPRDGFIAALETADCRGTVVYATGLASRCIEGAQGAVPSRDGKQIAFSMHVPVINETRFSRYDIAVLDVATGDVEVVAEGAYSGPLPPRLQWSRFGDLLLVSWPHFAGL